MKFALSSGNCDGARFPWLLRVGSALLAMLLACLPLQAQSNAADSAWARGDRSLARQLYAARLATDSTDALALFRMAQLASWVRDFHATVRYLDRLLTLHPEDRDARAARARAIAQLGNLAAAIDTANAILAAFPDAVGALQARARFAAWNGDLRASERWLREALARDSNNADTRVALAQTLRWQGRPDLASAVLAPARQRWPDNTDVREEAHWLAQQLQPHTRSGITREDDSDGNGITTLTANAAARPMLRLELRAGGYLRHAGLNAAASAIDARGVVLTASYLAGNGWTLEASGGASRSNAEQATTLPALAGAILSPRRNRAVIGVGLTRTPFDYTAPLARNRVVVDEARATLDLRASRDWSLALAAATARFDIRGAGLQNHRASGEAHLMRRLSDALSLALGMRVFGFDRDLSGGYFDPDLYGIADLALGWHWQASHWTVDAEAAPGVQQVGSTGSPGGAARAAGTLAYDVRPGRRLALRGVWANTGLQQLSPGAGAAYRYTSASLLFSWWF